jgi:hypothetical protein
MRFMAFSSEGNALDLADSMTDVDSFTLEHSWQSSWRRRQTETKRKVITVIDIDEDLWIDREARMESKHILVFAEAQRLPWR